MSEFGGFSMDEALGIIDGLLLVIVAMWNYAAHWTPWRIARFLVDENGELYRIVAYAHGTLTIFSVSLLWALIRWCLAVHVASVWSFVMFLALAILGAGAGTILPRVLRWIDEHQARDEDIADYEQAIQS